MRATVGRSLALLVVGLSAIPAAAHADPAWTCNASSGWVAAGGQTASAPSLGGEPCPVARADAPGATGSPGSLAIGGTLSVDGGASPQTIDARKPQADVSAKSLEIRTSDGKLDLTAQKLESQAAGACDANRQPVFSTSGDPGKVTLNGRMVSTSSDYSEPGVGVNGAPLFGKITIHFNEVTQSDTGVTRRAIHLVVTDRNGAIVFEAVAGEVSVGRDGPVCDPPPVCPPGTQPQAGHCVSVTVSTPPPPPPTPPVPAPPGTTPPPPLGGGPGPHPTPGKPAPPPHGHGGCPYADALAGSTTTRHLASATLCLLNVQRKRHHIGPLRASADLVRAALRHARDMVKREYFSHTEPSGPDMVQRILHSGYLERYGRWRIGENLGWGWGSGATPRSIVAAWMRSLGHRRNILNRHFHDVGVAVATGSPRGQHTGKSITYVIDFGGFELIR